MNLVEFFVESVATVNSFVEILDNCYPFEDFQISLWDICIGYFLFTFALTFIFLYTDFEDGD